MRVAGTQCIITILEGNDSFPSALINSQAIIFERRRGR